MAKVIGTIFILADYLRQRLFLCLESDTASSMFGIIEIWSESERSNISSQPLGWFTLFCISTKFSILPIYLLSISTRDHFTFRKHFFLLFQVWIIGHSLPLRLSLCSAMMLVIIDISVWNGERLHPFDGSSGMKHL